MFSNNDKISSRQIKRLLVFDLFGVSSLLLPQQLAKTGNGAGLWGILIGFCLAGLYIWAIHVCNGNMTQDYLEFLQTGWGRIPARLLYVCYALISICACGFAAKLLTELVCSSLLDNREFLTALFLIVLLAFYGGIAGLEARARVYEILFWVLAVPVVIMLLLCVRQVQAVQWFPLWRPAGGGGFLRIWEDAWRCFAAFMPLTFLLFLMPHIQEKKQAGYAAAGALVISGAALAVIYLILAGIFGSGALAGEQYPIVTLMGMVKIPGDFVKRLDAVMVSVWFFTLYALIGSTLYYGVAIVRRALSGQDVQEGGGQGSRFRKSWFFVMSAAVYGIAYGFHRFPQAQDLAGRAFYLIGAPFLVLVPLVSIFLWKAKN